MSILLSSVIDSFKDAKPRPRLILYRSQGRRQGAFKRFASPTGIGERIKPFVFLDDFDVLPNCQPMFSMDAYSGIATLTLILAGALDYKDTTGKQGTVGAGGVGWMHAGGGSGHHGRAADCDFVHALQLRIALLPEDENSPAYSQYLAPEEMRMEGPARVILGRYGEASSSIATRAAMNFLHIKLKHGARWRYQPPAGHTVGWVYPYAGRLHTTGTVLASELAVYEESNAAMDFLAEGDTEFVLGSAVKHQHELVLGNSSVHTNRDALQRGEAELEQVRSRLGTWRPY